MTKHVDAPNQSEDFPKGIGNPARNAFRANGYVTVYDVAKLSEKEMRALHGVGPKAISVLRDYFNEHGINSPLNT